MMFLGEVLRIKLAQARERMKARGGRDIAPANGRWDASGAEALF